jgi:hypothetical protein
MKRTASGRVLTQLTLCLAEAGGYRQNSTASGLVVLVFAGLAPLLAEAGGYRAPLMSPLLQRCAP